MRKLLLVTILILAPLILILKAETAESGSFTATPLFSLSPLSNVVHPGENIFPTGMTVHPNGNLFFVDGTGIGNRTVYQLTGSFFPLIPTTSVPEPATPIPEPSTFILMGVGLAGLAGGGARRRFKKVRKEGP